MVIKQVHDAVAILFVRFGIDRLCSGSCAGGGMGFKRRLWRAWWTEIHLQRRTRRKTQTLQLGLRFVSFRSVLCGATDGTACR